MTTDHPSPLLPSAESTPHSADYHLRLDATQCRYLLFALRTFDQYHGSREFETGQFCRDLVNLLTDGGAA